MNYCCAAGNCSGCKARWKLEQDRESLKSRLPLLKAEFGSGDVLRHVSTDDLALLLNIFDAAMRYGESEHAWDSHCHAGDHDNCTAMPQLEALDYLAGGPLTRKGPH